MFAGAQEDKAEQQKQNTIQLIKDMIQASKEQGIPIDYGTIIRDLKRNHGDTNPDVKKLIVLLQQEVNK